MTLKMLIRQAAERTIASTHELFRNAEMEKKQTIIIVIELITFNRTILGRSCQLVSCRDPNEKNLNNFS
jgi:hypothetical protein